MAFMSEVKASSLHSTLRERASTRAASPNDLLFVKISRLRYFMTDLFSFANEETRGVNDIFIGLISNALPCKCVPAYDFRIAFVGWLI